MKQRTRASNGRGLGLAAGMLATLMTPACETAQVAAKSSPDPVEIVRIWPGAPPGTESWTGPEVELDADLPGGKVHIVTNVTTPALTVFRPEAGKASGTAMLVLPGGAFRALAWDLEGTEVGQWLARRGITAFVLKYRVRSPTDARPPAAESFEGFLHRTKPAREVALADAQQALRQIRADAKKYGVAADRVGMIGFSAGAITTMDAVVAAGPEARPDFAAPIYGAIPAGRTPPAGAPPLFIVAAQDDPQVPPGKSLEIFQLWSSAQLPAELHLYEKGGHGFGMRLRNLPLDNWPAALERWLVSRGLAIPAVPPPRG